MLQPEERTLLTTLLEAPEGFRLEHAIATTFTLDLTALLTIPLGFAGADLNESANKLAVMQSVQQYVSKIDVFAQSGMVKAPHKPNALLAFLEPIVHQVSMRPGGHLFHPKIWVLRYSHVENPSEYQNKFRLICGSRNLTFDRSWDAAIVLDGDTTNRRISRNKPLCDFLATLPGRSGGLEKIRQKNFEETISELNTVEWEQPVGVVADNDWLKFHIFGVSATKKPDISGKRALVISPFANLEGLEQFTSETPLQVISRAEEINSLDERGRKWAGETQSRFYVVNDDAATRDLEDEESGAKWDLTGLHAKVYVIERGHHVHLMIGSSNATNQAWGGNDEILVEIKGRKSVYGIDTLLGEKTEFKKILLDHEWGEHPEEDADEDLRRTLENKLRELAELEFIAQVSGDDEAGWQQVVTSNGSIATDVPGVSVELSLVTLPAEARVVTEGKAVNESWVLHRVENATPFVVLRLRADSVQVSTVVLARLIGAPEDRLDKIIAQQFENKEMFLQFVALLLASSDQDSYSSLHEYLDVLNGGNQKWMADGSGLLEILLRALSRSPKSIDDVGRLVERLRVTKDGKSKLPEGWDELWTAVSTARAMMGDRNVGV